MYRYIRSIYRSISILKPRNYNLIKYPVDNYIYFYQNQYKINEHDKKILNIIAANNIDKITTLDHFYPIMVNHIESMYSRFNMYDKSDKRTYHYDFAKDFLTDVTKTGLNTRLFFTTEKLTFEYLMHIRPTCLYCVQFLKSYHDTVEVEGKKLDCRELPFHDMGHAHVMNRQDRWLFETLNQDPIELIKSWVVIKNKYFEEINKLQQNIAHTAKLYLFDIVHDRGYQFYLPILKQQLGSQKNIDNFRTKILRGDFNDILIPDIFNYIDQACDFLINLTNKLLIEENLKIITKFHNNFIIKQYLQPLSYKMVPVSIIISNNGYISVNFGDKLASLYEIELLNSRTNNIPIFDDKMIAKLNNINETVIIDKYGNISTNIHNFQNNNSIIRKKPKLKKIEIFKLERLFNHISNGIQINFTVTKQPIIRIVNNLNNVSKLDEISIEYNKLPTLKYINKDANARFIKTSDLKNSYIRYKHTVNPDNKPYVELNYLNENYELSIVDTNENISIAKAISSVLTRSVDDAKNSLIRGKYKYEGYIPENYIERAQLEFVSPYGISNLWGKFGYRFVLSKKINDEISEIVATALIASSKSNLFFFTHKYNNIKLSHIDQYYGKHQYSPNSNIFNDVDLNILDDDNIHKWFDRFDIPDFKVYKPYGYNQLANFCVEKEGYRGIGLGKFLIESIIKYYSIKNKNSTINHSQPLICGDGLFQLADPSWKRFMIDIGFRVRIGAESFYIDRDWAPLIPIKINNKIISNSDYNKIFGLNDENITDPNIENEYLLQRAEYIKKLDKTGKAKLQYYQMLYPFPK